MLKTQIKVSKEYKSAVQSVCKLIQGGCFEKGKFETNGTNLISTSTYDFVLTEKNSNNKNLFKSTIF